MSKFDILELNNEKKLFDEYLCSCHNVVFDKILFLSRNFDTFKDKELFIKICLDSMSNMMENMIKSKRAEKEEKKQLIFKNDYSFESLFLSEIIEILYGYYFKNNCPKINELLMNFFTSDNKETPIKNDDYKLSKDILLIRSAMELDQSLFSINYNKLSESKQIILDDKYSCFICSIIVKNEKPLFCYQ